MESPAAWRSMEEDTRGILNPGRMQQVVQFERFEPPRALEGLVNLLWSVQWELPGGQRHEQETLTHPCANISVGHARTRVGEPAAVGDTAVTIDDERVDTTVVGVGTTRSMRQLTGRGWNAAARTAPGAFGAFLTVDAADLTDRIVPTASVIDLDDGALVAEVAALAGDAAAQVAAVARVLEGVIERADPARVAAARETAAVAVQAEQDRSLRTAAQLARASGYGLRTLQRLFRTYAGVSPAWMLRRYRLIEAAEAARGGRGVSWIELARELGYADQAHLTRDFKAAVGQTPTAYLRSVTPLPSSSVEGSIGGSVDETTSPT